VLGFPYRQWKALSVWFVFGAHPSSPLDSRNSCPSSKDGLGVKMVIELLLISKLRIRGAKPPFSLLSA
jgi:hypothetical protein